MLTYFSHMIGQTTQGNSHVNLELFESHWFCYLCILSKIVTYFLSYGPLQVREVAQGVLDEYWKISSWSQGPAYEGWHCNSAVFNTGCSQRSRQDDGGNVHEILQVRSYWNTIFTNSDDTNTRHSMWKFIEDASVSRHVYNVSWYRPLEVASVVSRK